jgi:hypothetical protein
VSAAAGSLRRTYDVHGVGVSVTSTEPAVIDALHERLGSFPDAAADQPGVRLEFRVTDAHPAVPARASSRPVYETPHGDLHYLPEEDLVHGRLKDVGLHCAATAGTAVLSSPAFREFELYLATHPLATIALMELLKRRHRFALHAACLASGDGRGVLVAGPSGAGKSTLTLALARAGLAFLSDDIVFLDGRDAGVRVLGFADALGITQQTSLRFPDLAPLSTGAPTAGFPKHLVRPEELLGAPATTTCSPAVLILPEVAADRPSRLEPLDPQEAWLQLVPDVLLTEPEATRAHLAALAALLAQVRCYRLRSGLDLDGTAREIIAAVL